MAWSPATVTEGCVELEAAFVPRAVIAAESGAGAEGAAVAQVGKLDRGQTYAPKISRRYAPGFHQKQGKRPKIFRRYAPEPYLHIVQKGPKFSGADPPPDFPTHIRYVSTALFSNLACGEDCEYSHCFPERLRAQKTSKVALFLSLIHI